MALCLSVRRFGVSVFRRFLRAAVGTGVRLTINLFGPLPLEFNLALPIAKGDRDDEQVFSFSVGGIF